jgi:hypothetical protein
VGSGKKRFKNCSSVLQFLLITRLEIACRPLSERGFVYPQYFPRIHRQTTIFGIDKIFE